MSEKEFSESAISEYFKIIQNVIARMAQNSFQIKAWSATLFTAIILLTYSIINLIVYIVLLIVIGLFWSLDSYYLKQERLFRKLYEARVDEFNNDKKRKDFKIFDMKVKEFRDKTDNVLKVIFSVSEAFYYLPFIITLFIFIFSYLILI